MGHLPTKKAIACSAHILKSVTKIAMGLCSPLGSLVMIHRMGTPPTVLWYHKHVPVSTSRSLVFPLYQGASKRSHFCFLFVTRASKLGNLLPTIRGRPRCLPF